MEKKLIISLFFALSINLIIAQNTNFNKRFSFGMEAAVATGLVVTDSCFYMSGVVADTVAPYNIGLLFACFDLQGNLLFNTTKTATNRTYETWFPCLESTTDGNFVVAGYSVVNVSPTQNEMFGLLIKYDDKGNIVFLNEYETPFQGVFYRFDDLTQTNDGGFAICGYGTPGGNDAGGVIVKVDSLGNKQWQRTFDYTQEDERAASITAKADGGYMLVQIVFDFDAPSSSQYYSLNRISLLDSMGIETKSYDYQTAGYSYAGIPVSLVAEENGNIILGSGYGVNIAPSAIFPPIQYQNMVVGLSPDLEVLWETPIIAWPGQFAYNLIRKIIETKDKQHYLAVGEIAPPPPETIEESNAPALLAKVRDDGTLLWQRYLNYAPSPNQSLRHRIYDVAEAPDEGLLLCGMVRETDFDILEETGEKRQQAWILKTDEYGCLVPGCHLTDSVELPENEIILSLYPNPTSDFLNIYYKQADIPKQGEFSIVDMNGRIVHTFEAGNLPDVTHIVSVSHLAVGMYVLQYKESGVVRFAEQFLIAR